MDAAPASALAYAATQEDLDLEVDSSERQSPLELTILMPCLNEAETVAVCVRKARSFLERTGIAGEVLVADNGSSDGSPVLARHAGARVVRIQKKGYGSALAGGIEAARGRFVVMGDSDDSYDFSQLDAFIGPLRSGYEMVMGHRFKGGIQPGAMPPLHRYLGNPLLSLLGRLLFSSRVGDFHCGLRAVERSAAVKLGLRAAGMEFASEMIVRATLAGWRIAEVPTVLSPAGRSRAPHLRTFRDGWRHLRFLLMMSPRWLMLYPGAALTLLGATAEIVVMHGPVIVHGVGFDIHTMLYAASLTILGIQLLLFSLVARAVGVLRNEIPMTQLFGRFVRVFTLERGISVGLLSSATGFGLAVYSVRAWAHLGLSAVDPTHMMRISIPSVTLMLAGAEIVFASFLLALTDIRPGNLDRP